MRPLEHAHVLQTPRSLELSPWVPHSCGTRLCTDWAFGSPLVGPAAATSLRDQPLSGLRRRGNSTGFPGKASASGGAPGGLAPLPLGCSPETCSPWASLDVTARLSEEDGDGSLREEMWKKAQSRGSELLPEQDSALRGAGGEKSRAPNQPGQSWRAQRCWARKTEPWRGEGSGCPKQDRPYWEHCKVRKAWAVWEST